MNDTLNNQNNQNNIDVVTDHPSKQLEQSTEPIVPVNNQIRLTGKAGRPFGTTKDKIKPSIDILPDIKTLLDHKIKWSRLLKIIVEEAVGGIKRVNGNGIEYTTLPDRDLLKWLFEQRFGKAVTRNEQSDESKEALKKLSKIEQYILPHNTSVTEDGKLKSSV